MAAARLPACARAGNRQTRRVASERRCLFCYPARCGVAIVHRDGELVLGRQAVVYGDHDGLCLLRQRSAGRVVCPEVSHHPAAAVEPGGDRKGAAALRVVDPHGDVSMRPRRQEVLHGGDFRPGKVGLRFLHRARASLGLTSCCAGAPARCSRDCFACGSRGMAGLLLTITDEYARLYVLREPVICLT